MQPVDQLPAAAGHPVRPLRRDAAENRERLLFAAAKVFMDDGLGAPVEDIAREAGVGMGTLYRRFPTKADLIEALVRQQLLDVLTAAEEAATHSPPGQALEAFLWATGELQARQSGCLARLWTEQAADELIEEVRSCIGELLDEAQRHGRIRDDIDGPDISMLLWGLNGVIATSQVVAPDAWRRALELSIAGLRPSDVALTTTPLTRQQLRAMTGPVQTPE